MILIFKVKDIRTHCYCTSLVCTLETDCEASLRFTMILIFKVKDIRTHCYCTSLVCTLFIRRVCAMPFSSALTKSKTRQNIGLLTFAITWCPNIFVGCSVTPTFFGRSFSYLILSIILKNKKICTWYVLTISHFANDPQYGPQIIPLENKEWQGICYSGHGFNFEHKQSQAITITIFNMDTCIMRSHDKEFFG